MSRPAFKWQRRRTTDCPTCESTVGHPCYRLTYVEGESETVSPHAARLRAEKALRESKETK